MAGRNLTQDELRAGAAWQSSYRAEQLEYERRREMIERMRQETAAARQSRPNGPHDWMAT